MDVGEWLPRFRVTTLLLWYNGLMKLLESIWNTVGEDKRIWVLAIVAVVLVAGMYFGALDIILEWLSKGE